MANPKEVRLVLIGKTGSGKSETGNRILGNEYFKATLGGSSVTKECSYKKAFNAGRDILVVDTPGLYDTEISNNETQREIKNCVMMSAPGPHAIIYVTKLGRFTHEETNTIRHFVNNFGEGMYKYLIVLFTGGDDLDADGKTLDEFIASSPSELKKILHLAGNRKLVFNNREKNVDALKRQVRALMQVVDQTVADNGGSCYTNKMYQEAEAELRKKEEEKRRMAEAKKQAEINRIKNECQAEMKKELRKIKKDHAAEMANLKGDLKADKAKEARHLETIEKMKEERNNEAERLAQKKDGDSEASRKDGLFATIGAVVDLVIDVALSAFENDTVDKVIVFCPNGKEPFHPRPYPF